MSFVLRRELLDLDLRRNRRTWRHFYHRASLMRVQCWYDNRSDFRRGLGVTCVCSYTYSSFSNFTRLDIFNDPHNKGKHECLLAESELFLTIIKQTGDFFWFVIWCEFDCIAFKLWPQGLALYSKGVYVKWLFDLFLLH